MISAKRSLISAGMAAAMLVGNLAFADASAGYAQGRSAAQKRRAPQARARATPPSVYGQGYQKGYGEGFTQGETDWSRGVPRDYERSDAYQQRESSYDTRLQSSEEYRQGYHLGFELGYSDGYFGRARNAAVPANGAVLAKAAALADAQREREREAAQAASQPRDADRPRVTGSVTVPSKTELRIKLITPIDTKTNRVGDKFSAEVILPSSYERAMVDGHISTLDRSGKVTGRTELSLTFDSITLADGRRGPLDAELVRVIESESVKEVDEEGNVRSGSRSRDSQVRGGVGAAAGAIIGGIAGGAKGAVLGAILGGAAGVGTVYIEGNKNLILDPGTEMVIRTVGSSER